MKWSDVQCPNRHYGPLDENEKNVRGAFLHSLGIDLENLPDELFEPCELYIADGKTFSEEYEEKVYIWDVVGTQHSCYGGKTWMDAFLEEHKTKFHILQGHVTPGKYFHLLKQSILKFPAEQRYSCIRLIKSSTGKYYVGGNGNHRITFYKLMYLADMIAGQVSLSKFWFYALVKDELKDLAGSNST